MICVLAEGGTSLIAAMAFTLSWTHSVERTRWEESWTVTPAGLELTQVRIEGSGAGMEPPAGAAFLDGGWTWTPQKAAIPKLTLAASGATVSPWRLCAGGAGCRDIGARAGAPAEIRPGSCG
jgi:hypothetical protein